MIHCSRRTPIKYDNQQKMTTMKPNAKNILLIAAVLIISSLSPAIAGGGVGSTAAVKTEIRNVPPFTGVDAGGAFNVYITKGEPIEVKVETDEEFLEKITTEVSNNVLYIKSKGIRNPGKLNIYITLPVLQYLNASGASSFKCEGVFEADEFTLEASGATNVSLAINVKTLKSNISGAADAKLSGRAAEHSSEVSGAGSLKAFDLETDNLTLDVSGAGDARVDVKGTANVHKSGAGSLRYKNKPQTENTKGSSVHDYKDGNMKGLVNVGGDSVVVDLGKIKIKRDEDEGLSTIKMGRHKMIVDDDGNVRFKREKRSNYFKGHWGGFDLSFNGFLNKDGNMDFTGAESYLDLYMPKSIGVHLNIYEQNVKIAPSGNFGFITGLGLEWHNYRFNKGVYLDEKADYLKGYIMEGIKIEKNKLVVSYLTLPLLFEVQRKGDNKLGDFHIAAGALLGVRLGAHTKVVFAEQQKDYTLVDPETGDVWKTLTSPREDTEKVYDDFKLNPFKADAMVRIGWGYINLFGTYSMTGLFRTNRGPELTPFAVGITLVGW